MLTRYTKCHTNSLVQADLIWGFLFLTTTLGYLHHLEILLFTHNAESVKWLTLVHLISFFLLENCMLTTSEQISRLNIFDITMIIKKPGNKTTAVFF